MTSNFKEGDIILGVKRKKDQSFHPIIYFGEINKDFFDGGMITHSNKYGNIQLKENHFSQKIDTSLAPGYFVRNFLIKKQEWGPFKKIGELSNEGLIFVKGNLDGTLPMIWEDFLK